MSRRRTHMAEPVDRVYWGTAYVMGRSYEFYDGARKNSLKRVIMRVEYETREWTGSIASRRKLAGNWRHRPATPEEIEQHRRMLPPEEIAHVTRECLAYRPPDLTPLQQAAQSLRQGVVTINLGRLQLAPKRTP